MNTTDARLEAQYEARERDPLPDETPMTDDEIQKMYRFFNPEASDA